MNYQYWPLAAIVWMGLFARPAMATHPMTIDDFMAEQTISHPQIAPGGDAVLYQVDTNDVAADKQISHLWLAAWDGTRDLALTSRAGESETHGAWSPDGQFITFLSDRGGDKDHDHGDQIWRLRRDGGEAEQLTHISGAVSDYAWAPDGRHLALIVADATNDASAPKPIVIDRFQFKADIDGYLGAGHKHLYLFDMTTRQAILLTPGTFDEAMPVFSPNGRQLAFVSRRRGDPDRNGDWAMFTIEAKAGATPQALTQFDGNDADPEWGSPPAWSPDSTYIAYVHGGPRRLIEYAVRSLGVVPANGGPARILTAALDRNIGHPAFAPDGQSIRFLVEDDRAMQLASVAPDGGKPRLITSGARVVKAFSIAANGHVALLVGTPGQPDAVFGRDLGNGGERQLSHRNDGWLAKLHLPERRPIEFHSPDGTDVHGFMLTPPGYATGQRMPTILRIHGGPCDQFDDGFDLGLDYDMDPQFLASQGYVVLAVNPRGSTGRGQGYAAGIYADWGNKDSQDVVAAVDWAIAAGVADPARLGVGGWSYGGILTNAVIARYNRFRAATSGAGISNILAGYGTDEYIRDYENELGTPWANTDTWIRVSFPFLHADQIVTPTLFMAGDHDFNVPLLNSEQMYQALRSRGIATMLIIYPGEFHVLTRPSFVRDRIERELAWYKLHLN